jgi:1-phosphatidylinositol phosphodiesterase
LKTAITLTKTTFFTPMLVRNIMKVLNNMMRLLILLIFGLSGCGSDTDRSSHPIATQIPPNPLLENWMQAVDGKKLLSEISIPGTHDSCASSSGGAAVYTQAQNLGEQLENGIRYLDIRCRNYYSDGWRFPIHHGNYFQNIEFGYNPVLGLGVLDYCYQFLRDHPSETIIMLVSETKSTSPVNGQGFEDTFDLYLANSVSHQNDLYNYDAKSLFWLGNYIPRLEEVRGKIVLLRRFIPQTKNVSWLNKGIDVTKWPGNGTADFSLGNAQADEFYIQDNYVLLALTATAMDNKWNAIYDTLERATDIKPNRWYLNYSSAAQGAFPATIAYGAYLAWGTVDPMNNRLYNTFLNPSNNIQKTGTIVMDYPFYHNLNGFDTSVVSYIIQKN